MQDGDFGVVEVEGGVAGEDGAESGEIEGVEEDRVLRCYFLNILIVIGGAGRWGGEEKEERGKEKETAHVEMRTMSNLERVMAAENEGDGKSNLAQLMNS